jgi:hypothetical protein
MSLEESKSITPTRKGKRGATIEKNAQFLEEPTKRWLRTSAITNKIKSVDHFIYLFANEGKYFLPPRRIITWEYIKQVLTGQKKLLKFNQLDSQVCLPRAKGLSIKNIYDQMQNDFGFLLYFPNIPKGTPIPRDFFLMVNLSDPEDY